MRKTLIILFVLLLSFTNGCNCEKNNEETTVATDEGEFLGVITDVTIDLDNQVGVHNKDVVTDEELALEIGNSILKSVYGQDILTNSNFVVYEIEGADVFVVSRVPKDAKILGGDYNVAIKKKDGAVLKIWAGE